MPAQKKPLMFASWHGNICEIHDGVRESDAYGPWGMMILAWGHCAMIACMTCCPLNRNCSWYWLRVLVLPYFMSLG
jgi:hypothetical protein